MQLVDYVYRYNALGQRDQVHETRFDPFITLLPLVLKGEEQELLQGRSDGQLESSETGYPPPLPEALEETEAPQSEGMETYPPPPVEEEQTSFLRQAWDFLLALFSVSQTVSASYNLQNGYPPPPEPDEPPLPDEQIIDYVYDPLGRLVEAAYSSGTTYEYEYDPVGNRTAQIVDSISIAYQYDAADRLTSAGGTAFTWDDNANLLGDGVYSYGYNTANHLVSASGQGLTYGFAYDGLGNRYQQTVDGQTNTYTLDLAGSLSQVLYDGEFSYYYGLGRISQQQGTNSEYYLPDALGSVRQIANSAGTLIYRQNFDPFGELIGSEGNGSSSYGYAGEWTDGTGLQNLRARYYAPQQGRFTSTDPFPGMMSQPATLNPYSYVVNNPIQLTDPSGEIAPILVITGIGFAAGAFLNAYQQTNGFSNFCHYDILQTLAWGVGGAAAAASFTIMAVSGVGLLGMGLQGAGLGLSGLGVSGSLSTAMFIAGTSTLGFSSTTMAWLWTGNNVPKLIINSNKMPNIAKNIRNAQANGAPKVLTRTENSTLIDANRRAACAGFCGQGSPDEYPFASTYEGGKGAYISGVPPHEQNIQGGTLNQFYRHYNIHDGDKFRVVIGNGN